MRKLAINSLIALLSFIFIIVVLELFLKIKPVKQFVWENFHLRERPWKEPERESIIKSDDTLGWVLKPGHYDQIPFAEGGPRVRYTIFDGGVRKSSVVHTSEFSPEKKVFTIGGSYTQGYAVSDEDTYSWVLQGKLPDSWGVFNQGVPGFGSYQAFLKLEKSVEHFSVPDIIIYGLMEQHADRNIAANYWIRGMGTLLVTNLKMPYVYLDDNGDVKESYKSFYGGILTRYSLIAATLRDMLFELKYNEQSESQNIVNRSDINRKVISKMKRFAEEKGSKFFVLYLITDWEEKEEYASFFGKNNINFIDCAVSSDTAYSMAVKGEGHPNPELHRKWGECLYEGLRNQGAVE